MDRESEIAAKALCKLTGEHSVGGAKYLPLWGGYSSQRCTVCGVRLTAFALDSSHWVVGETAEEILARYRAKQFVRVHREGDAGE